MRSERKSPLRGAGAGLCLLAWLTALTATAHEYWISAPAGPHEAGRPVEVRLGSGHGFPESEWVLRESVLGRVAVRAPGGEIREVETEPVDSARSGAFVPGRTGPHVVFFTLRRPRRIEPVFHAATVIEVGGQGGDPADYRTGTGLELAPEEPLAGLAEGGRLAFTVRRDGEPLTADIRIMPPDRRAYSVRTRAAPTPISFSQPGVYLLVAYEGGEGASFTLRVPPSGSP